MVYQKTVIILIFITFLLTFFFIADAENGTQDPSAQPGYGYSVGDIDNNGITDAFDSPSPGTIDSTGQKSASDPNQEPRRRSGHKNLHGQHGKEVDRGQSPHKH
jgi:hypothetical protein